MKLTWHDGENRPDASRISLPQGSINRPNRAPWIGERGSIFKNYRGGNPVVLPETDFPAEKYPTDLAPQNHYHDWVDAILAGRKACDDFSHGGPLTEAVLVGAMADRAAGDWLHWNRESQTFTDNESASALVRREYRDGWQIEGLG
ncbi:MAG: hypothetical protein R3C56_39710 [Pirellulaceae bacterium]